MKVINQRLFKIFTIITFLFLNFESVAQNNVSTRVFIEPYSRLQNAFHVQPVTKYDSGFRMLYELPFNFLFNQVSGTIVDMYGPGYVNIVDTTDINYLEYATFYPFRSDRLTDISDLNGSLTFQSKLLRKIDTLNGELIFKLEWRNIGFADCTSNDSLNMQLWLFEKTNKVQFRYGESNMISLPVLNYPDTPIIAFEMEVFDDFYFGAYDGLANNLIYKFMDSTCRVIGIPPSGTVIEFVAEDSPTFVKSDRSNPIFKYIIRNESLIIDFVNHKNSEESISVIITDLTGKSVLKSNSKKIDISSLDDGVYIVRIATNDYLQSFKIKI